MSACDHPRPGRVLFLADPYCWYTNRDVREYLGNPAYAAEMHPCPTCAAEVADSGAGGDHKKDDADPTGDST